MKLLQISIDQIEQNENSRTVFKKADLAELMASLKKDGLLEPVGVRKLGANQYEAVFGNRRILAAKNLGWDTISAVVVEARTDLDRDILGLVENIKRQNTTLTEDGRMFWSFKDKGMSEKEIAVRLDLSPSRVEAALDAYKMVPRELHSKINNGRKAQAGMISASTANAILALRRSGKIRKEGVKTLMLEAAAGRVHSSNVGVVARMTGAGSSVSDAIKEAQDYKTYFFSFIFNREAVAKIQTKEGKPLTEIVREYLKTEFGLSPEAHKKQGFAADKFYDKRRKEFAPTLTT